MKDLNLTIVHLLGILVPGLVLLLGVALLIYATGQMDPLVLRALVSPGEISSIWILTLLLTGYVLGFVLRLLSVRFLNLLSVRMWHDRMRKQVGPLEAALKRRLNLEDTEWDVLATDPSSHCSTTETHNVKNKAHCTDESQLAALNATSLLADVLFAGDRFKDPIPLAAPYFHYAKRLLRVLNEGAWAEAERMEAELRLTSGLMLPLAIFMLDGLIMIKGSMEGIAGWALFSFSLFALWTILGTHPRRRVKEVEQVHILAIACVDASRLQRRPS